VKIEHWRKKKTNEQKSLDKKKLESNPKLEGKSLQAHWKLKLEGNLKAL